MWNLLADSVSNHVVTEHLANGCANNLVTDRIANWFANHLVDWLSNHVVADERANGVAHNLVTNHIANWLTHDIVPTSFANRLPRHLVPDNIADVFFNHMHVITYHLAYGFAHDIFSNGQRIYQWPVGRFLCPSISSNALIGFCVSDDSWNHTSTSVTHHSFLLNFIEQHQSSMFSPVDLRYVPRTSLIHIPIASGNRQLLYTVQFTARSSGVQSS
jgi:hypothetical protein